MWWSLILDSPRSQLLRRFREYVCYWTVTDPPLTEMVSFSTIAKRDNGRLPLSLRIMSIFLATGALIASLFAMYNQSFFIMIPSIFILVWDTIYVILLLANVRILLPVTITFDLIAWLISIVWGILYAIWSVPEMGRYLSAGMTPCSNSGPCTYELQILKARFTTCVLLWTLTWVTPSVHCWIWSNWHDLISVVHFATFVRAIITLEGQKAATARNVPVQYTQLGHAQEA